MDFKEVTAAVINDTDDIEINLWLPVICMEGPTDFIIAGKKIHEDMAAYFINIEFDARSSHLGQG